MLTLYVYISVGKMVTRFYVTLITNRLRETDGAFQSIQIQYGDTQIERGESVNVFC